MDLSWIMIIIGAVLVAVYMGYSMMDSRLKAMETQMANMMKMLSAISSGKALKEHPVNSQLRQLVQEGKKVQAIKMVREHFGLSLVEAKNYIDELDTN